MCVEWQRWDGPSAPSNAESPLKMLQAHSRESNPDQCPRDKEEYGDYDAMNSHAILPSYLSPSEPAAQPDFLPARYTSNTKS